MIDSARLFRRRLLPPVATVLLSLCAGALPAQSGVLVTGTPFTLEEFMIEAREACDGLRGRERRRCVREAEAEARASAERLAAVAPVALAYRKRLVEGLAAEGDARSLALAAVLGSDGPLESPVETPGASDDIDALWQQDPRVVQWRDAALAASAAEDKDDPLVLVLAYVVSGDDVELQRALIARWRAAEPDNLQPILVDAELRRADTRGPSYESTPLPEPLFADAVRATRYREYFADLHRLAIHALRRHPPTEAELQAFRAHEPAFSADAAGLGLGLGFWVAGPSTAYAPLFRSCDESLYATRPGRREDCRRLGRLMSERGETLIGHLVGVALLRKTASDEAQREEARALREPYEWRSAQMQKTEIDLAAWSAGQVALLLRESDVTEAQMVEAGLQAMGLPTEPPAGWHSGYRFMDEREAEGAPRAQ